MSFKAGDKVVCLWAGLAPWLVVGGAYTVAESDQSDPDFIRLVETGRAWFLSSRFELFSGGEPTPPTAWDGRLSLPALPVDAQQRKSIPLYSGVVKYFPDALAAVAELSRIGNDQHNPGKPLHWDRSKSGDELDALMRHLTEAGTIDNDGVRHSTKVAWRAMANLQKEIEDARLLHEVRS